MEIKLTLPGGGTFEFKKEPMSRDRFEMICWLIGIFIVGSGVLKLAALVAGI